MPWTRPTLAELQERVEGDITSRLTSSAPLMRKAVLKIIGKAQAVLAHLQHGFLQFLAVNVMPDQAERAWLLRIARARGLNPPEIAATPAKGSLALTGVSGTAIPAGTTIFVSDAGLEYATDAEVTISGGNASVSVTCQTAGVDGNLPDGAVLALATSIPGLNDSATADGPFVGGADLETTEALRERLLAFIQTPPAGGSASDYVRWAKSVAGVRNAWPLSNYYGGGTVALVISATGEDPVPSVGLVEDVQAYIDQEHIRPVTANVTVVPIEPMVVDVDISITPYNSGLVAAIQASLATMFEQEARPGGTLYMTQLQRAIHVAGVLNYLIEEIQVNDVTEGNVDFPMTGFQYMVLGEVNVFDLDA